jgi:hypothetical protein
MPRNFYQLQPIADQHRDQSEAFILDAAKATSGGRALILGAGECAEIPLQKLLNHFNELTLNDLATATLEEAIAARNLNTPETAKIRLVEADLTGLSDVVVSAVASVVAITTDPQSALIAMADAVDKAQPAPVPIAGQYDLVVASCVLCQLHVTTLHRARTEFLKQFPGQEAILQTTPVWADSLERMARRMEREFVDHLLSWTAPGGRIYFSETVRVAFLEVGENNGWQSEGNYRLLKSGQLADYLDNRFTIESQRQWHWVFKPPKKPGDRGRLFDVQAMILSATKP